MKARFASFFVLAAFVAGGIAVAATAKLSDKPQGAEVVFVASIQKDLMARFPTAADAEKAGYFRFTNEDETGSISYADLHWTSGDPQHPSQLWYDTKGHLLGADFSQPYAAQRPKLWGINPARWEEFDEHVHFVVTGANGKDAYHATSAKKFVAAGGSLADPQATTLVKMGLVKDAASVKHVFVFPHIWDLIVWVKENPNGAFANMNPLVKPTSSSSSM